MPAELETQSTRSSELTGLNANPSTSLIRGEGEMAERIRSYAWSATPLGAVDTWPPELLTLVNLMLASREIATVFWGPERLMIYNDRYTTQLGKRHPVLGKPLHEVWPEVVDQVNPFIAKAFDTGQSSYLDDTPLTVLEDGRETERYYNASFEPVWVRRDQQVRVEGVFQTAVNNTAKIEAQRELAASVADTREARFQVERTSDQLALALDAAGLATWSYDPETQMIAGDAKMAEFFGVDNPTGPAELWLSKIHPDDQQRVGEEFGAAVQGQPYETVYRILRDDKVCWIKAKARQVSDYGHLRMIGLCEDITRLKSAEAALIQNEKLAAVGRLASSISHEINNPLESVTNLLFLIGDTDDIQHIREYTDLAERELRRVSLITNQTLRFYRQTTGPTHFFCQDLIGDSLSLFQGRLVNSKIEVEKRKRAGKSILCLGGEIRQVLTNLIGNAIDAMPFGGRLILRSREATDWKTGEQGLALTVADTGIGMSPQTQRRIFEAFFSTKGIGGTGLGLWISSEIVDRHRGRLRVRSSQSKGHTGSVFTLFLPFNGLQGDRHQSPQTPLQEADRLLSRATLPEVP